jgi:DNA-binding CsgD family transcriptional regulator
MSPGVASSFVGRERHVAELTAVLQAAVSGVGRVAIVEGEAGIGKTRLVQAALELAGGLGLQPFAASAHELGRERAFGAVIDAFGLRAAAGDLARREIVALLGEEPADRSRADRRFSIIEKVVELVETLAVSGPLLVLFEDLHWADSSTVLTIHRLAGAIAPLPVAMICTARPQPRSPELASLFKSLTPPDVVHLGVEPLEPDSVIELATDFLGLPPGPHLLAQLGGAAGNPLYVSELLAALGQEGLVTPVDGRADVGEVSLPPSLRLTILRRLSSLSDGSLEVVRVASVLGSQFAVSDLALVTRRPTTDLLAPIAEAVDAGVLGDAGPQLTFRHDLVREAIYDDMLLAVRKALHARAARALAEAGRPLVEVAAHAAVGAEVGDTQAAAWLQRAAEDLTPRAPLAAVELLERALALVDHDKDLRDQLRLALARAFQVAEHSVEAARVAHDILASTAQTDVRFAARRLLFQALGPAAVDEIDAALAEPGLSPTERARLTAEKAEALVHTDRHRTGIEAARAIVLGEAAGDPVSVFLGTLNLAFCNGFDGHFDDAIVLAERAEQLARGVRAEDSRAARPEDLRMILLVWADRFEEAGRSLDALRPAVDSRGAQVSLRYHYAKSHLELWTGHWDEAMAVAEAGLSTCEQYESGDSRLYRQLLCFIAIHRDELAIAEAHLRDLSGALWIPALLAEAKGDHAELAAALHAYRSSVTNPSPWNMGTALWTLPDWVRLYLNAGDRESARILTGVLEEAARRGKTPTARGAALRCRGLCEEDVHLLVDAVEAYDAGPRVFDRAQCLEWAALGLAGVEGQRGRAVDMLTEALAVYEGLAAVRDAARAEAHLRRLGVRRGRRGPRKRPRTGWPSLTPSERRVAGLVVEGLSYREIGDRLFISRRTVETHVVHIFGKLGLASRRDLADDARRHGMTSDALAEEA